MFVEHTINSIAPTRRNVSSRRTSSREVMFGENLEMKIVWMRQRDLIASQRRNMRFGTKSGVTDGFVWRCKRKGCKTTISAQDEK